jgi:hypothetical protein
MKTTVFLMTAAFAVIAHAFADAPVTPPAVAGAPASQDDAAADNSYLDRIVCRKLPPRTGTLLGSRKVCQTERQWREITRRSQEDITKRQTFHASRPGE